MVSVLGVDGEGSDCFAGCAVDDSDVVAVDEQDDAGSVEGSPESDVVHFAVDAQADASGVDAVVADPELAVGCVVFGGGFGSGGVRDGGCCAVWLPRSGIDLREQQQ